MKSLRTGALVVAVAVVAALAASGCSSSSSHASVSTTTAPGSATSGPGEGPGPSVGGRTTPPTTAPRASTPVTSARSCSRPHPSGQSAQSFAFQGVNRTYQLYVPSAYTGTKAVPVVFDFHGFGSNAVEQMVYGNFKPEADRDDFLIVAPDGQFPAARHFNLTGEKGLQNDLQMVGALLDHIEATFCVDARRVYSTGMSDGGATTSVLACTMSNRFAAFGPVAVVVACGGPRSVPIMGFAGTADPVVPFNGGQVHCCGGSTVAGAVSAMASWAVHDHCAAKFDDVRVSSEVTRRTWPGCDAGSSVTFYMIAGGGHTWPGSPISVPGLGMTTRQIDASATIWQFFRTHALT